MYFPRPNFLSRTALHIPTKTAFWAYTTHSEYMPLPPPPLIFPFLPTTPCCQHPKKRRKRRKALSLPSSISWVAGGGVIESEGIQQHRWQKMPSQRLLSPHHSRSHPWHCSHARHTCEGLTGQQIISHPRYTFPDSLRQLE